LCIKLVKKKTIIILGCTVNKTYFRPVNYVEGLVEVPRAKRITGTDKARKKFRCPRFSAFNQEDTIYKTIPCSKIKQEG